MPPELLHRHPQFGELIAIVADEMRIVPALVEKDYWIMHSLWGLQQAGHAFELKGGISLSKGYGWIGRFSEDIDIRIEQRRSAQRRRPWQRLRQDHLPPIDDPTIGAR